MKIKLTLFIILLITQVNVYAQINIESSHEKLQTLSIRVEKIEKRQEIFKNINISGQLTTINQSSSLAEHQSSSASVSGDIVFEKSINNGFLYLDVQLASGQGVDASLQGGAMVNNDIMEDANNQNQAYIAKAYYHQELDISRNYRVHFNLGKLGVNDYFDPGIQVSDQSTQFLNQAVNNNGAFDYVQDLSGHGYTYGAHINFESDEWGVDAGVFGSDSYLDNINKKYSTIIGLKWTPAWEYGVRSFYQIYAFSNKGEYGSFNQQGDFQTVDVTKINTNENEDNKNKNGLGINLNHRFINGIDIFAKYGEQDDNRDVRHYQDMDKTYLIGMAIQGNHWKRELDALGFAYEVGQLTGNHQKAHEKGYEGFFDRSQGIGAGNYKDEIVFEMYYRYALNENSSLSLDYQNIKNFNYDKNRTDVNFIATRFNVVF